MHAAHVAQRLPHLTGHDAAEIGAEVRAALILASRGH
jgi:hypothetical protein